MPSQFGSAGAHRATSVLDAVADYRFPPTALDILVRRADVQHDPTDPHTIVINGTQVQFQDVAPVDLAGLDDKNLLYVAAHSYAMTSAMPFRLVAAEDRAVAAIVPIPRRLVASTALRSCWSKAARRRAVVGLVRLASRLYPHLRYSPSRGPSATKNSRNLRVPPSEWARPGPEIGAPPTRQRLGPLA